jgi:hypothetical protein
MRRRSSNSKKVYFLIPIFLEAKGNKICAEKSLDWQ